jgi:hypothetical protein
MARIIDGSGEHLPSRDEANIVPVDVSTEVFAPGEVDMSDDVIDLGTVGSVVASDAEIETYETDTIIPDDDPVFAPDAPAPNALDLNGDDDDDDDDGLFITRIGNDANPHEEVDSQADNSDRRSLSWGDRAIAAANDLTKLRSERGIGEVNESADDAEPTPEVHTVNVADNTALDVSRGAGHQEHHNGNDADIRSVGPELPDSDTADDSEATHTTARSRIARYFDRLADRIVPDIVINLGPEVLPDTVNNQAGGAPVSATKPTPPPAQWPAPMIIDPLLGPNTHRLTDVQEVPGELAVALPAAVAIPKEPKLDRHARRVQRWQDEDAALLERLGVREVEELTLGGYEQSVVVAAVSEGLEHIGFGLNGPFDRQTFHGVIGAGLGQLARGKWQRQTADLTELTALRHDAESAQYAPNITAVGVNSVIRERGARVATATVDEMFDRSVTPRDATQQAADLLGVELADIPFDPFGRQLTDYREIAGIIDAGLGLPISARTDHIVTFTRGEDREKRERLASTMLLLQDPVDLENYYLAAVEPTTVMAPSLSGSQQPLGVMGMFEARAVQPHAHSLLQRLMDQATSRRSGITIEDDEYLNVRATPTTARSLDLVDSIDRLIDPANIGLPMGRTFEITPEAALGELSVYEGIANSIRTKREAEAVSAHEVEVLPAVIRR